MNLPVDLHPTSIEPRCLGRIPGDPIRLNQQQARGQDLPMNSIFEPGQPRQTVDLTTDARNSTRDEEEFVQAMQDYKKVNGRMFPTWSEILEVLGKLGYRKTEPGQIPGSTWIRR